ncbi:MAG: 50S ribosomal protein L10 [Pyrinomonadaceae bacterium]
MKSRQRKQADLAVLTDNFKNSKSAVVLSFNKLTVEKDQQFRNQVRETGAKYSVVKNTLARLAVKDTPFEDAAEHFKGVTSVAWTDGEAVALSKVISKFLKENKDNFEFKTGVVEGKVIDLGQLESIATLPSKEELIGKLLYLLNAPAQRLATVLSAIPRDLAVVIKQVSETRGEAGDAPAEAPAEAKAEEAPAEEAVEAPAEEAAPEEAADEQPGDVAPAEESSDSEGETAEEPAAEEESE